MPHLRSAGLRALTGIAAAHVATLTVSLPASAQGDRAVGAFATTLKIGVIGPFTGGSADFGVPMPNNGILQAVDEINGVGGYYLKDAKRNLFVQRKQ